VALITAKRSTSRSWVRAPPSAIPISKLIRAAVLLLFPACCLFLRSLVVTPIGGGRNMSSIRTYSRLLTDDPLLASTSTNSLNFFFGHVLPRTHLWSCCPSASGKCGYIFVHIGSRLDCGRTLITPIYRQRRNHRPASMGRCDKVNLLRALHRQHAACCIHYMYATCNFCHRLGVTQG
jgi:hypothetical protein